MSTSASGKQHADLLDPMLAAVLSLLSTSQPPPSTSSDPLPSRRQLDDFTLAMTLTSPSLLDPHFQLSPE
eukprot:753194-Hanusia_phi.AAC.3